jgi:hypothetical protein
VKKSLEVLKELAKLDIKIKPIIIITIIMGSKFII